MKALAVLAALVLVTAPLRAQWIDPDWCLTCVDTQQHAMAGAGLDIAAIVIFPRINPAGRVLIVAAVGVAYEAGQASALKGPATPGYGFSPKDLLADVAGAILVEVGWALLRRL